MLGRLLWIAVIVLGAAGLWWLESGTPPPAWGAASTKPPVRLYKYPHADVTRVSVPVLKKNRNFAHAQSYRIILRVKNATPYAKVEFEVWAYHKNRLFQPAKIRVYDNSYDGTRKFSERIQFLGFAVGRVAQYAVILSPKHAMMITLSISPDATRICIGTGAHSRTCRRT